MPNCKLILQNFDMVQFGGYKTVYINIMVLDLGLKKV